jgi:hypothetical protein
VKVKFEKFFKNKIIEILRNFAIPLIIFHILHEPKIMKGTRTQTWLRKFDDGLKMHLNCNLKKVIQSTFATTAK